VTTVKGSKALESGGVEAGSRTKRRSWSLAERQRIVDVALAPGASVAAVARSHDVNANLVFKWIRRSREGWRDRRCEAGKRALRLSPRGGEAPSFVPVRLIAPEPAPLREAAEKGSTPTPQRNPPSASRLGAVEIRLPNGAQVRIEDGVDGEVLRLVLSTLSGQ
jgi:transposase